MTPSGCQSLRGVWPRARAWVSPASAARRLDPGLRQPTGGARGCGSTSTWSRLRNAESDDSLKTSYSFYSSSSRGRDPGSKGQSAQGEWTRTTVECASYVPAPPARKQQAGLPIGEREVEPGLLEQNELLAPARVRVLACLSPSRWTRLLWLRLPCSMHPWAYSGAHE